MTVSKDREAEKACFKPWLKYKVSDQVFLKTDKKRTYPMLIVGYEFTDYNCNDYYVIWFNSQGKKEADTFPEECLTTEN